MALLDEMRRAQSLAEKAAAVTELMMFYGQAFIHMRDALTAQGTTALPGAKILHECVCGLATFTIWQKAETPINPQGDHEWMAAHWRTVTEMVLGRMSNGSNPGPDEGVGVGPLRSVSRSALSLDPLCL